MSKRLIIYVNETIQISPGHPSNICRTPKKYLQDTHQIFLGHLSNIFITHIKYLKETYEISPIRL